MPKQQDNVFSDRAKSLASLSAQALGWLPGNFWAATPSDLALALQTRDDHAHGLARSELNFLLESDCNG